MVVDMPCQVPSTSNTLVHQLVHLEPLNQCAGHCDYRCVRELFIVLARLGLFTSFEKNVIHSRRWVHACDSEAHKYRSGRRVSDFGVDRLKSWKISVLSSLKASSVFRTFGKQLVTNTCFATNRETLSRVCLWVYSGVANSVFVCVCGPGQCAANNGTSHVLKAL